MLYSLIQALTSAVKKSRVTAEAILFILIAQHAAFSDISLKVDDILAIKVSDIDQDALTILAKGQEIDITVGLKDILLTSIETKQKPLFQKLNYDNLEETLEKHSQKLFGFEGKLHPRDFLEKVHVIPYARISVDLRKQISDQEKLAAHSPYRINAYEIKKEIKASIRKKQISSMGN